jgi:hypothetical protein
MTITNLLWTTMMSSPPLKFFIFFPGFQLSTSKFLIKVAKDLQKVFTNGGLIKRLVKKKRLKKKKFTLLSAKHS